MSAHERLIVLDFGSQVTQLIARRIREQGVSCEIRPCTDPAPSARPPRLVGLILSGGPSSVLGDDAPPFDPGWLALDTPILGICYGMQLMAAALGGSLGSSQRREYGHADITISEPAALFAGVQAQTAVWMSHGDHVESPPAGWRVVARSSAGAMAAMADETGRRFGLQFHPEVTHTAEGVAIIGNFLFSV